MQKIIKNHAKSCFSIKKLISNSERCAEHPLACRNTQHMCIKLMKYGWKSEQTAEFRVLKTWVGQPCYHVVVTWFPRVQN